MMDEQLGFDHETGELPISERAIAASDAARFEAVEVALGIHNGHLNAAIMAALAEMPIFVTATADSQFNDPSDAKKKRKYANLQDILEEVRPRLYKQGVRIRQGADRSFMLDEGGGVKGRLVPVYTDLIHVASGEIERTTIEMPVTKLDAGAMGSAITYGKRYTLIAALSLATGEADDDGEATKVKSMNEAHADGPELAALTRDLNGFKDATKLAEWTDEGKTQQRYSSLSPAEQATLRARKAEKVRQLLSDDAPPATAPKRGKAAE